MTNLEIAAQTIKDNVSALDVGQVLGLNIDRHGRCSCPFHCGKDRNLKLFLGNRGYSCFVCHAGGDVISFVQRYYSMSFKDTIAWFNDTFHLGISIGGTVEQAKQREAEKALLRRKNAIAFQEWKERMAFDQALTADEIVRKLETIRDANAPKNPYEPWNVEFRIAVGLLPEARRFVDDCMMYSIKEVQH